jgi:carboxypeptidase Taq
VTPQESYVWLEAHFKESAYLAALGALAGWDQQTLAPPRSLPHRARMEAELARLLHQRATLPELAEHLERASSLPGALEQANLREWKRAYERARRVPEDLAAALAQASAEGTGRWAEARPKDDWPAVLPSLKTLFALHRELGQALGFDEEPYDGLLDGYEPGARVASIAPLLSELREELKHLLARLQASPHQPRLELLMQPASPEAQEALILEVLSAIGFDLSAGRLDRSPHPFTQRITPGDVRLTTRYDPHAFHTSLMSALHEAGHGLYEQGLPEEHFGTPAGEAVSLGFHESQSRLWENFVGRSQGFWRFLWPKAQARIPSLHSVALEPFWAALNAVRPGPIRVEADEVTYNLHILIRFELELEVLRGKLAVEELPEAWEAQYQANLGIRPSSLREGVLQDMHWYSGLIGYFPTYTLGTLYAAQLFARAQAELGPFEEPFARGEFRPLLNWLREHIHAQGSRWEPQVLLQRVSGETLNPKYLVDHLWARYGALYEGSPF